MDGYEECFATNHLAHFLLAKLLLPTLKVSPERDTGTRLFEAYDGLFCLRCVSSESHWRLRHIPRFFCHGEECERAFVFLVLQAECPALTPPTLLPRHHPLVSTLPGTQMGSGEWDVGREER